MLDRRKTPPVIRSVPTVPSVPGTREKIDAILQLIDLLEVKSGSANLDDLENLAEKEKGIDRSDFGALISRIIREGLITETEDEKGVRRAGTKPSSTATDVPPNDARPSSPDAEPVGPTCGDCEKHGNKDCVKEHPELIRAEATYPKDCRGFVRRKQEVG